MRTDFPDTDPRHEAGPYPDGPSSADREVPTPLVLTPAQLDRSMRAIVDPWASYLDVTGACTGCGGRTGHATRCPHLAVYGLRPGDTVGKPGPLGVALGLVRSWPIHDTVSVEWEDAITTEDVPDLLTDPGACAHGADASGRCGAPTAPGFTECAHHDGADPLPR